MNTTNTLNPHPKATTAATPPKSKFLPVTVLLMAISPLAVQGAITVTGGGPTTYIQEPGFSDFSYTVQNTNSMLVLGFYSDNRFAPDAVTFGGVAPDETFTTDDRTTHAYWSNPDTGAGDFAVTNAGSAAFLAGVYELAGVDLSGTVTSSTGETITTPTDNEFVISYAGGNTNTAITVGASSIIDSNTFGLTPTDTNFGAYLAGGTAIAGSAGSQDVTWDGTDDGRVNFSFQAIPEPSSTLLLGLGGLALILRRRR